MTTTKVDIVSRAVLLSCTFSGWQWYYFYHNSL